MNIKMDRTTRLFVGAGLGLMGLLVVAFGVDEYYDRKKLAYHTELYMQLFDQIDIDRNREISHSEWVPVYEELNINPPRTLTVSELETYLSNHSTELSP